MSKQPRKQRNQTERAPLHERHKQVKATLAEDLREEYDQRSVRVNAGDTVEIMRGDDAGEEGEILEVDLKNAAIYVEDVTVEAADGEELPRALDASNLRVTDLDLDDDRRQARLEGED
ncbi:MAG: 50S ribosomal protein L24 [Halobacteriales archaeon]|nr:50S ribosomal protein L24 [Halobacteriales archaeon]